MKLRKEKVMSNRFIIRTKTLFVDVILAFPPPNTRSLALPQKIYIFLCILKILPFFFIRARRGSVHRGRERENQQGFYIFYLWLYFWVSRVPLNVVESALYKAKTVIVLKVGFKKIDERYLKFHLKRESGKCTYRRCGIVWAREKKVSNWDNSH